MPSPSFDPFWAAMRAKDYETAKKIITDNPDEDLINSVHPMAGTVISICCIGKEKPLDFIKFIAPKVDLQYQTPKRSNIKSIIHTGSEEVFKLFEAKIDDILFNNGELSYAYALQYFKGPNYVVTKLHELTLQHSEMIIRKAMATDNPILLEQLEKMGIDPSKPLSDGIYPARLTKKGSKTNDWFREQLERNWTPLPCAVSKNPNAFELWRAQELALETLTKEHNKKQAALYEGAANELAAEVLTLGLS